MQCNQLIRLIKDWYLHVKEETMAPARMMQFTDNHIKTCAVCLQDPDIMEEVEKIRDIVLPESKIPKSTKEEAEKATPEISPDENSTSENGDSSDDENTHDAVEED